MSVASNTWVSKLEKTHSVTGTTCKLNTERPWPDGLLYQSSVCLNSEIHQPNWNTYFILQTERKCLTLQNLMLYFHLQWCFISQLLRILENLVSNNWRSAFAYSPCIFLPDKNCLQYEEPFTKTMKLGVPALTKYLLCCSIFKSDISGSTWYSVSFCWSSK